MNRSRWQVFENQTPATTPSPYHHVVNTRLDIRSDQLINLLSIRSTAGRPAGLPSVTSSHAGQLQIDVDIAQNPDAAVSATNGDNAPTKRPGTPALSVQAWADRRRVELMGDAAECPAVSLLEGVGAVPQEVERS
jgi:hypothetical protein